MENNTKSSYPAMDKIHQGMPISLKANDISDHHLTFYNREGLEELTKKLRDALIEAQEEIHRLRDSYFR